MAEKRLFEREIEDCIDCPAHLCFYGGKCRCEILDRVIPENAKMFAYPKWCPLKIVK